MTLESAPEVIATLSALAKFLNDFGLPGLIAVVLLGPTATAFAFFVLDYFRHRQARQEYAARRQEEKEAEEARRKEAREERELLRELLVKQREQIDALVERHREHSDALVGTYRAEVSAIVRDLGLKHAEVVQFYKDNVELVKTTQRMAGDMRDIILNNTRAVEHLSNAIGANFYCPAAREAATGKK